MYKSYNSFWLFLVALSIKLKYFTPLFIWLIISIVLAAVEIAFFVLNDDVEDYGLIMRLLIYGFILMPWLLLVYNLWQLNGRLVSIKYKNK